MAGPTPKTVKRLFAFSANRCAFPDCGRAIVQPDGTVTGEICHIEAVNKKGPRYNPELTKEKLHSYENLILLCEAHHKIVDADIKTYTESALKDMKERHKRLGGIELSIEDARKAEQLLRSYLSVHITAPNGKIIVNSPGAIQADTVKIMGNRTRVIQTPHPESLSADLDRRNYIKYLIDRYNKFQFADKDKSGKGKYVIIYNAIKNQFGMKWDAVPLIYFDNLVTFLQRRILNSKIGRIRNAQGYRCFSCYEDWIRKPEEA